MSKKILLSLLGLVFCMAANAAYQTTWPIYGEVVVEDYFLADDNSTITSQGDAYYWYQYSPLLQVAALRSIYPSNASGERDFVLVPTYIIVDGLAYHVVGVSGTLLGNNANTIRNIYLNDELEFLGTRALYNAIAVTDLTIPASVKAVSYDAFNGMAAGAAIRTLTFADSSEPLTIEGASSNSNMLIANLPLTTLHLGRTFAGNSYGATSGSTLQQTLVNLTVGGQGTDVNPSAFKEFKNLTNVTFKNGVRSIGNEAFRQCPKLETVTMTSVARICQYAFYADSAITTLTLGPSVKYIDDYAFGEIKRISSLALPASVDSVHVRAFVGMKGVTTLTIADTGSPLQFFGIGAGFYGSSAFSHLTALESAYVGRNLLPTPNDTRFSTPFFASTVAQLTLGNKVTALNADEFHDCTNLVLINTLNTTPPVCANATTFDGIDKTACALHVPQGCKPAYQAAPVWRDFYGMVDDLPNDNPSTPGDLSGDGVVNGNDLNILINIILGKDDAANYGGRANVDGQGGVDGNDLNKLINIILGK